MTSGDPFVLRQGAAGAVVDSLAGETNLISDLGAVTVEAEVRGAVRVVVAAGLDIVLDADGQLRSDTGNVGVLAGELATGGRLLMAPSAVISKFISIISAETRRLSMPASSAAGSGASTSGSGTCSGAQPIPT